MQRKPTQVELEKLESRESEVVKNMQTEDEQQKLIRAFRKANVQHNIFLYPCNQCKKYGMMLHLEACCICSTKNQFYDPSCRVTESVNSAALTEIMNIAEIGDPPRYPDEPILSKNSKSAPP